MSFNNDDLAKIAHLARLETPQNIDLGAVVGLFDELEKVDTKNITPMAHPLDTHGARMREDIVSEDNMRSIMQKLAPSGTTEAGFYLVPPVIE